MNESVCILMATYNGERYLDAQLESIYNQSFPNWRLFIRDDGSTDSTLKILKKWSRLDKRIEIVNMDSSVRGQLNNFDLLMKYSNGFDYDYIMFSDQDDIWFTNKIKTTLDFLKKNENGPTLIYTNYLENDKNGNFLNKYKFDMEKMFGYSRLLVQNWIMGCTIMVNASLFNICQGVPKEAENHDNWIVLMALTYGKIVYLNKVTMFHRIHNKNVTNNFNKMNIAGKVLNFINEFNNRKSFQANEKNLTDIILSRSLNRKNKYIEKYNFILKKKNKLKRILMLKHCGINGLNKHKTLELWLKI